MVNILDSPEPWVRGSRAARDGIPIRSPVTSKRATRYSANVCIALLRRYAALTFF
jgi:hypothetical protein